MNKYDFTAVFIIPTGIGASIGGFAGDASPFVKLISKVCPVITNPNAVNAAVFSGVNENVLYTEGYSIDSFFKGKIALRPSKHNKIGVIFDKAIPKSVLNVHINTINAVKSTLGINIIDYILTKEEVGVNFLVSSNGISTGNIQNPETLIDAGFDLINKGAEALAVVCFFETNGDAENFNYSKGIGIDPVGGVEAVISHILSREFNIPVAHAPAFNESELIINSDIVDPRAAAEFITPTFLPCILIGLYNAPKIIDINKSTCFDIELKSVKAIITPFNCLGSIPILSSAARQIPIIAVESNKTMINVTSHSLNLTGNMLTSEINVSNYYEAAGFLLALKEGIMLTPHTAQAK